MMNVTVVNCTVCWWKCSITCFCTCFLAKRKYSTIKCLKLSLNYCHFERKQSCWWVWWFINKPYSKQQSILFLFVNFAWFVSDREWKCSQLQAHFELSTKKFKQDTTKRGDPILKYETWNKRVKVKNLSHSHFIPLADSQDDINALIVSY